MMETINRPKVKHRAKKGQLTLHDVGMRGSEQKGDETTRQLEGHKKTGIFKWYVCERCKPKTVSGPEAPTAEVAPKLGNNSSEEVVAQEMQCWIDLEKNQMMANILKNIPRPKNTAALGTMRQ